MLLEQSLETANDSLRVVVCLAGERMRRWTSRFEVQVFSGQSFASAGQFLIRDCVGSCDITALLWFCRAQLVNTDW